MVKVFPTLDKMNEIIEQVNMTEDQKRFKAKEKEIAIMSKVMQREETSRMKKEKKQKILENTKKRIVIKERGNKKGSQKDNPKDKEPRDKNRNQNNKKPNVKQNKSGKITKKVSFK